MARAHKTFHINVPEEDLELMEWLSVQYNQSSSVRELIRAAYREYGLVDLFTGQTAERTPGVRGRAKQAREVDSTEQSRQIATSAARAATGQKSRDVEAGMKAKAEDVEPAGESARDSMSESVKESSRASAPKKKDKSKARAPSKKSASETRSTGSPPPSPPRKRGGIRMDASVLLGASGKSGKVGEAKSRATGDEREDKGKTEDKKKDAISDLMRLMDL